MNSLPCEVEDQLETIARRAGVSFFLNSDVSKLDILERIAVDDSREVANGSHFNAYGFIKFETDNTFVQKSRPQIMIWGDSTDDVRMIFLHELGHKFTIRPYWPKCQNGNSAASVLAEIAAWGWAMRNWPQGWEWNSDLYDWSIGSYIPAQYREKSTERLNKHLVSVGSKYQLPITPKVLIP